MQKKIEGRVWSIEAFSLEVIRSKDSAMMAPVVIVEDVNITDKTSNEIYTHTQAESPTEDQPDFKNQPLR